MKIYKWPNVNKLKLNIDKTKWMVINKKELKNTHANIQIGKEKIERVQQIKYLGIILDEKLTLHKQIEEIIKKVAIKVSKSKRSY